MKPEKPASLKQQIIRGAVGFCLIAAAVCALMKDDYAVAFVCAALSFIALRGCPSCWVVQTRDAARKKDAAEDKPDEPQQG